MKYEYLPHNTCRDKNITYLLNVRWISPSMIAPPLCLHLLQLKIPNREIIFIIGSSNVSMAVLFASKTRLTGIFLLIFLLIT